MTILIKNGTIVTAKKSFKADILVADGKISRIGQLQNDIVKADKQIDAAGLYVFPGGIDPHVHMHLPSPAGFSSDDFYTGSKAALYGGTTTIIDFVTPQKGQSLPDALAERKKEAQNSLIDYSFHVSPIEWHNRTEKEIKEIKNEGITSFKTYMAYKNSIGLDDDDLFKIMKAVAKTGGLLTVHAELGDDIEELRTNYAKANKLSPKYHPLSRPDEMEAEAVKKAIELAKKANCSLYIVHVSAKESLVHIRKAQKAGQKVYAESCPHYLLLDDSRYDGTFEQTAPFVLSPPLRKKEDQEALWDAIADNIIQTTGTDHCPFTIKQKQKGKNDFRKIPNGAGGVEHRLTLLYTYGVLQNKFSINNFVDIISTQAAKTFGLYPRKGEIAVGSDADLIIWNPDKKKIISSKNHKQHCDINIFEGFETYGFAEYVIVNGQITIKDGKLIKETSGRFLKR
jgi:dihydropyrimidinase